MSRGFFGTDGIRGRAGDHPLDKEGVLQIGKAVGAHFTQPGDLVLVGLDTRESSPWMADAVAEGLRRVGARVEIVGVIPTPGLLYLTQHSPAKAGVMITASHNPYQDNGIKIVGPDGEKLSDATETHLTKLIAEDIPERAGGHVLPASGRVQEYEDWLVSTCPADGLRDFSLAVDMANGATSGLAGRVLQRLGAKVFPLFDKPDGRNINSHCGATDPTTLQHTVAADKTIDAGIAFDGDGDRVQLVDKQGRLLGGDHLLYILALTDGHKGVVTTTMSNMALKNMLKLHGIALHRTDVGDRYVSVGLQETGFRLGGEQSGHIIISDYLSAGDGLLAAMQLLRRVAKSGKTLEAWYDELQLVPQKLVSIPIADKGLLQHPEVIAFIAAQAEVIGEAGRLNIRAAGTEALARIMVEAPDAEQRATAIATSLQTLLHELGDRSTTP